MQFSYISWNIALLPILLIAFIDLGVGRAMFFGASRRTAGGAADKIVARLAVRLGLPIVGTAGLAWFQGILGGLSVRSG